MKTIDKDAYFNHGVDMVNRRVFLDGDIDEASVRVAIRGLYLMETNADDEPIEMFINSFGGSVYGAMAIFDIMNTIKCPIHTFAYGKCMSAAPLLLANGTAGFRWVSPNVSFMYHDWSDEISGTAANIKADVKHVEELDGRWTRELAARTGETYRFWKAKSNKNHDFYFWADEAIEWGLADHIWIER